MDKNCVKKYDKLIRDRIPEIIAAEGKEAVTQVLDDEAYEKYLNTKLGEELKEYLEAGSIEELADLVEVVYALLDCKKISIEAFEKLRIEKVEKRGAFKKRLLLKEVGSVI